MTVKVTSGTASGCWGIIKSNTSDTLTVYGSWLSSAYASNCGTPDATSVFGVYTDGFDLYDNSWTGGNPDTGSTFAIIYLIPHASYNPTTNIDGDTDDQLGNNGPLTPEILNNWKGTKLPTSSDFFGFCGYKDGGSNYESTTGTYTADKTYGNYGGQIGRTDEFFDLANSGSWEWLSEQHYHFSARLAGSNACSFFDYTLVN